MARQVKQPVSIQQLPLLRLPDWQALPPNAKDKFVAGDEALARISPLVIESIQQWLSTSATSGAVVRLNGRQRLYHRLSDGYVRHHRAMDEGVIKSLVESRIERSVRVLTGDLSSPFSNLAQVLKSVVIQVLGEETAFRTSDIESGADLMGGAVCFPDPSLIPMQIDALKHFIIRETAAPRSFVAAVTMIAVTNMHFFRDGNGRVSRILFSGLLRPVSRDDFYFPIYELASISRGGFIIRARLAEHRGNWEPLGGWLLSAVRVLCKQQKYPI